MALVFSIGRKHELPPYPCLIRAVTVVTPEAHWPHSNTHLLSCSCRYLFQHVQRHPFAAVAGSKIT